MFFRPRSLSGRLVSRLPRRTVRLRLTLLYGGLFLVSGAALLAVTYVLVVHRSGAATYSVHFFVGHKVGGPRGSGAGPSLPRLHASSLRQAAQLARQAQAQRASERHQLLVGSALALALMTVVSVGLGWLVAGRVLRPLRTMATTTRRISEDNLHERLALAGPDDELKDLADTIDDLLARLEAAFEAQRRFVANASHELRTPLTMMRTSLDVSVAKPEARIGALEVKLREGLDRADRLVESFLVLARAQHGGIGDPAPVSLPDLVRAAIHGNAAAIGASELTVETRLGDATTSGSEVLLARLVENLVENAARHNRRGGGLRIVTGTADGRAYLLVESDGPRLDEDEVGELAQPFRRLDVERTHSGGVGLGLSIVAAIVAAHDGGLDLRARPEGGLAVEVDLPRASVAVPA